MSIVKCCRSIKDAHFKHLMLLQEPVVFITGNKIMSLQMHLKRKVYVDILVNLGGL